MPSSSSPADTKSSIATRRLSFSRYSLDGDSAESTRDVTQYVIIPPPTSTTTLENDRGNMTPTPKSQPQPPRRDSAGPKAAAAAATAVAARAADAPRLKSPATVGSLDGTETSAMAMRDGGIPYPQHDVSGATSSPERLSTGAMVQRQDRTGIPTSAKMQLNQYRDRLARDLERQQRSVKAGQVGEKKKRVSPIQEESGDTPPSHATSIEGSSGQTTTTSTESGNTIRGGMTPGFMVGTPSYPFPRMASSGYVPSQLSFQPYSVAWPGEGTPPNFHDRNSPAFGVQDKVLSDSSTPASNLDFNPPGTTPPLHNPGFPLPNLYELSLTLHAEPGLDAWWDTVVKIMTKTFKAERVTLSVPADTADIDNVPWGQKATYNEHQEDGLSLGYLARGASFLQSSTGDAQSEGTPRLEPATLKPSRPSLFSRHSFTTFEEKRGKDDSQGKPAGLTKRPSLLSRSKSYLPPGDGAESIIPALAPLNKTALEAHDAAEEQLVPKWEAPLTGEREVKGRVLQVIQALNYEADPLIDDSGVTRVLERCRVIALTRSYPYLGDNPPDHPGPSDSIKKRPKQPRSELTGKNMSVLGGISQAKNSAKKSSRLSGERKRPAGIISRLEDDAPRPPTPKYEEYEQAPPSPWSQSPAPSPAVRPDPKENPFFTDAMVDEESFNPTSAATDYSTMPPPETIGVDNSWTVLHIPLKHVLLSHTKQPFHLDSSAMEQKAQARSHRDSTDAASKYNRDVSPRDDVNQDKVVPIAIISILSPIIPYPSTFRHALEHLSMHLATSYSLSRHYSNLEMELAGLQRRRPNTVGFGALDADGRPVAHPTNIAGMGFLPPEDAAAQGSLTGSITSPSECSGLSRSAAGSPSVTPGGDQGSLAVFTDKRMLSGSPLPMTGDSYFSAGQKQVPARAEAASTAARQRRWQNTSKESSPVDRRHSRVPSGAGEKTASSQETPIASEDVWPPIIPSERTPPVSAKGASGDPHVPITEKSSQLLGEEAKHGFDSTPTLKATQHRHTLLHTYGADFKNTFPSLTPSSNISSKTLPSRSGSVSAVSMASTMAPPSDRLKSLILDSLPAHVFVALPQDGEIVWVNSRFLIYRGLSPGDLAADPWGSIHPDERDEYLKAWSQSLRTGDNFSRQVRVRRFDGAYRWFQSRAVASRDKRGVIVQFLGSFMDIHDQKVFELKATRQQQIEESEAQHRLLANLIPQIIFTADENNGITFANQQWLSYTGQTQEESRGLGFMDFVHPDDLAKCQIPLRVAPSSMPSPQRGAEQKRSGGSDSSGSTLMGILLQQNLTPQQSPGLRSTQSVLSRNSSSSSGGSLYEGGRNDLSSLARKGIIKVATDSNGRLSYTTEVRLRSKAGEYRWHLIRCVEIDSIDFGNGVSQYFGSATDINDHKLLEAKLKDAMESKGRFLSNMSHEIRTPLIGISGMVTFLQDTTLDEEQRDYTNTIQTSANSLLMIINDILDLSKVDAGMMKLKHEWFHTRSLIEDVNELVSTMAFAKQLELNYIVEEDVPAWVKGDKIRIRQVLLNVIGNAIKFTTVGEVFSRCRVYQDKEQKLPRNDTMLEFAIIDTGRGFTDEEAELIFKPFSQIDGSSTRQHGGSGLGLVISRQLVELHGGTMSGTAVPGKGSTFTFTAKFTLPTADDFPELPLTPPTTLEMAGEDSIRTLTSAVQGQYLPRTGCSRSPSVVSQLADTEMVSPTMQSSGSSDPSLRSAYSMATDRSSAASSVHVGLARFSEAARVSGQDISELKLAMPASPDRHSPELSARTATNTSEGQPEETIRRPQMYSILIICPQTHSREATRRHIEMTLPKDVPYEITVRATADEALALLNGDQGMTTPSFTHIVINLFSAEEVIALVHQTTTKALGMDGVNILVLSDTVQRQKVIKLAADESWEPFLSSSNDPREGNSGSFAAKRKHVTFIYKPVKPSRFAVIFDPDKRRDLSIDRNRSTAQRMVESQKASYLEMEKRIGKKGHRVLLVEDNMVNQKVLYKYLEKVGVEVQVAADGEDCTSMVFGKPAGYYSLILCDLHMPRKDGYTACRDIRRWERNQDVDPSARVPIIALSANVMSDVQEKCAAAGFNDYVTKPVDFIDLSRAMAKFF